MKAQQKYRAGKQGFHTLKSGFAQIIGLAVHPYGPTPSLPAEVFNVPPVRHHSLDRCTEERPVQPMLCSALVVARLFSLTKKDQKLASP